MFHGEALARYAFPAPHPFSAPRLPAFWREFLARGLDTRAAVEEPEPCAEADLLLFHTPDYVARAKALCARGGGFLDQGDTPAFPGAFEAARAVVGTTLKGVRLLMEGRYKRAFNPIGGLHHARPEAAGGFCVANDIGVAVNVLRRAHGVRRIGYVDIDAHHGDGVYYPFADDPDFFIGDIHEDGRFLYPGTGSADETGRGPAAGTKLNVPLPPDAGESAFVAAFEAVERLMDAARPEFFILQCGADSLADDPLAHLALTPACHAHAARRLRALADAHAGGRLLALGGGGYKLANVAAAWCAVAEALA